LSGLFFSCFWLSFYIHFASPVLHSSHPPWFDLFNCIWWRVQIMSLLITYFLYPPVTFCLQIMFSNTLIYVFLIGWCTKFHTHIKQVKWYSNVQAFREVKGRQKRFCTEW
jgi:hypothetical protein